jgi:hypothetical protein
LDLPRMEMLRFWWLGTCWRESASVVECPAPNSARLLEILTVSSPISVHNALVCNCRDVPIASIRLALEHQHRCRATTHTDLALRAMDMGIEVRVIHNASIMNAVASCGLQLYNFGQTITIPFWTAEWQPDSFFDKIMHNVKGGLHTLCLLGESWSALRPSRNVYVRKLAPPTGSLRPRVAHPVQISR